MAKSHYVGLTLVIVTGLIIFGGVKRIGKVSARMSYDGVIYLIVAVIILGMNIEIKHV